MKLQYTSPSEGDKDGFHSIEVEENGQTTSIQHFHEDEIPSFDGPKDLVQLGETISRVGRTLLDVEGV